MIQDLPFDEHVELYESWFDKHSSVFETELAAIKKIWPGGKNLESLEIASATGRFSKALNITKGIDPSLNMAAKAEEKGIHVLNAEAEDLPYADKQFHVVLMNFCISYLEYPRRALEEAFRVLKTDGCLILGFIDRNSRIGKYYQKRQHTSIFYEKARFYSVAEVERWVIEAGFIELSFSQTLFHDLDKTFEVEDSIPGFGKGSYVLVKAVKRV